jgi:parallel beta-helix repeat protein
MEYTNQTNQIVQTSSSQKAILGGLSLTLVVGASLVALWRGAFVSSLNAANTTTPNGMNLNAEQDQLGNNAAVILVPEHFATIQGAIDQAADGSVIFVAPGQYRESIRIHGKDISLQATNGAATASIVGSGRGGPIALVENSKCMIDGFRIQDGRGANGRGLEVQSSNATIVNCTFTNNAGGVSVFNSKAQFIRCVIAENRSAVAGGGLWSTESDVRMSDCTVKDNAAGTFGGGVYALGGSMQLFNVSLLQNRVMSGAWGGGLYSDRGNVDMNACVMQGNFSHESGAAMYVLDASAKIRDTTFKGNSSTGEATVVGANAAFDIQSSILENETQVIAAQASNEPSVEIASADAMETSALMMAAE